jgi:hypothetical protein
LIALVDVQMTARGLIAAHATFSALAAARVLPLTKATSGKTRSLEESAIRTSPGWVVNVHPVIDGDTTDQAAKTAVVDAGVAVSVAMNPKFTVADIDQLGADLKDALTNVANPAVPSDRFYIDPDKAFVIVTDDEGLREYMWFFRRKCVLQ